MGRPKPMQQRQHRLRQGRVALVAAAFFAITACGPAASVQSAPRAQEESPAPSKAAAALIDAERVVPSFAAIPAHAVAELDLPEAQGAALLSAGGQVYRAEGETLRRSLLERLLPAGETDLARSLATLAAIRTATQGKNRSPARGGPANQAVATLAASMAASRFAAENTLAARRLAWATGRLHRDGTGGAAPAIADEVSAMIAQTRQAQDSAAAPRAEADNALIQALATLTPAQIDVLTRWYASEAGRAARDRLVGSYQAANDRAARVMLIRLLTDAPANR